MIFGKAIVTW